MKTVSTTCAAMVMPARSPGRRPPPSLVPVPVLGLGLGALPAYAITAPRPVVESGCDEKNGVAEGVLVMVVLAMIVAAVLRETAAVGAAAAVVLLVRSVTSSVDGSTAAALDGVGAVDVAAVGPATGGISGGVVSEVKSPNRRLPRLSVRSPRPKRACTSGPKGGGVAEEDEDGAVLVLVLLVPLLLRLKELTLLLLLVAVTVRKVVGGEGVMAPGRGRVPLVHKM